MSHFYRNYFCVFALTFMLSLSLNSVAQSGAFKVTNQVQTTTIPYVVTSINGVDYLSLPEIIQALGGAHTTMARRMRVDLGGTTAWISLNDNRVNALSYFSLTHKVISNDDGIFISRMDCPVFFQKAFQVSLVDGDAPAGIVPPTPIADITPDLETIDTIETPKEFASSTIRTILLDPGHGGYESGLSGVSGSVEKNIVLTVALRVQEQLNNTGKVSVVMTRKEDVYFTNQQRAAIFMQNKADLMISLHAGGAYSPDTQGFAVMYPTAPPRIRNAITTGTPLISYTATSRMIAGRIASQLGTHTSSTDRGVHAIPNALFKMIDGPACMIELGCLTNNSEEAELNDPVYQDKLATGIVQGILEVLDGKPSSANSNTLSNSSISDESSENENAESEAI